MWLLPENEVFIGCMERRGFKPVEYHQVVVLNGRDGLFGEEAFLTDDSALLMRKIKEKRRVFDEVV